MGRADYRVREKGSINTLGSMCRWIPLVGLLFGLFHPLWAQISPLKEKQHNEKIWGVTFDADSYFYNAEFSHPLKPGYTLPGVVVHPGLWFALEKRLYLNGGYFYAYMHGKKEAQVQKPTLSLRAQLAAGTQSSFWCILGTLRDEHPLPSYVYSPQYGWLHGPEAGAQLYWTSAHHRLQTWIDWDRFIWKDANDEERFLYGLQFFNYERSGERRPHFTYNAFFLARHHGGQIDTSHLRVVTSTHAGINLGWTTNSTGIRPAVHLHGSMSHDGHHDSPLPKRDGWAVAAEGQLHLWEQLHFSLEYFYGKHFISLRGEELYRSYSFWSDGAMHPTRSILDGSVEYEQAITAYGRFSAGAKGYYDVALRRIDYDFYLRLQIFLDRGF